MKNRILFKANAAGKIGYGHFKRCLSLAELLKENNFEVYVQTNRDNPLLSELPEDNSFKLSLTESGRLEDNLRLLIKEAKEHSVNWVVLDGYEYDAEFERAIRRSGFKLIRIADTPTHLFHCDVLLSPNYGAEHMGLKTIPNAKVALGLKYFLIGKRFRELQRRKREKKPLIRPLKILITLGGSQSLRNELAEILLTAVDTAGPMGFEFDFIIGSEIDRDLKKQFENSKAKIRLYDYISNIEEYMIGADFVVCSAGTTMWELIYLGIPFGVLPLNNAQAEYVTALENAKLCLRLPEASQVRPADIVSLLQGVLNNPESLLTLIDNSDSLMDRESNQRNILDLFT